MRAVEQNNNKFKCGSLALAMGIKNNQGNAATPSKVIELGGSYRFFVPMIQIDEMGNRDVMIAMQPGRKLEREKLNRTFVPINNYDRDEENGNKIIDKSGLIQYARLSRVLHDADCEAEKKKAEKEAKSNAEALGQELDVTSLKIALKEIDVRYHGDQDAKPNPIYPELNPAIGGMTLEIATEVLVVPLDKEGAPQFGKVQSMQLNLSTRKAQQLSIVMANKDYYDGQAPYMEIHYTYVGTNRKEAGQAAVLGGVSKDVSLASKYPDLWQANIGFLDRLPKTPEAIRSRNGSMSSSLTPKEVISMFETYMSKHATSLLYLDYEDEAVQNCAEDLLKLEVVQSIPKVQESLLNIVQEMHKTEDEVLEESDTVHSMAQNAAEIETLSELEEASAGFENLDNITGGDIDEL